MVTVISRPTEYERKWAWGAEGGETSFSSIGLSVATFVGLYVFIYCSLTASLNTGWPVFPLLRLRSGYLIISKYFRSVVFQFRKGSEYF